MFRIIIRRVANPVRISTEAKLHATGTSLLCQRTTTVIGQHCKHSYLNASRTLFTCNANLQKPNNKISHTENVDPSGPSSKRDFRNPPKNQKASTEDSVDPSPVSSQDDLESDLTLFQRFRSAYKEHGKVLIGVHVATSTLWLSTFYYAAASGIDLGPLLEKMGASHKIIEYLNSSVGNLATAYLMYKLATPARYTVTLFGTYTSVKYLRKWGYLPPVSETDSIRLLMKDGRSQMKDRYSDMKDEVKDKIDDIKTKADERKEEKRKRG